MVETTDESEHWDSSDWWLMKMRKMSWVKMMMSPPELVKSFHCQPGVKPFQLSEIDHKVLILSLDELQFKLHNMVP